MTREEIPQEKRTPCEVWTRVMGYHRPVSGWNSGKQSEFRERKCFREPASGDRLSPGTAYRL
nr:MAG TPA: anaerobic ribonucleoside triphosphate reductase [Caudoviricetes sp.]